MRNEILRKRIIRLVAMSYGMKDEELWKIYENMGDLNKLLNLLENNELDKIK